MAGKMAKRALTQNVSSRKPLQGVVVSAPDDKTVVVRVDRAYTHPVMKKTVRRSKKYHAADAKIGDTVWIEDILPPAPSAPYVIAGKTSDGVRLLRAEVGPKHFSDDQIRTTIRKLVGGESRK